MELFALFVTLFGVVFGVLAGVAAAIEQRYGWIVFLSAGVAIDLVAFLAIIN